MNPSIEEIFMFTHARTAALVLGTAAAATIAAGCSSSGTSGSGQTGPAAGQAAQTIDVPGGGSSAPVTSAAASSTVPAAIPDACTLLSHDEAQKLAGVKLQKGDDTKARSSDDIASCIYDAPPTGPSGSVQLFAQIGLPHALGVDKAIHHKFRSVPGIGDQTLEEPENSSIFVRKGQIWIYLTAPYSASPKQLEKAASEIASRLS
jgi:hypothetical protein